MDLWVVGAAAAAGYVAKYCHNISRGKVGLSWLSPGASKCENLEAPSYPLQRLERGKKSAPTNGGKISDEIFLDVNEIDSVSERVVSTSGYDEDLEKLETNDDYHILSFMSLEQGITAHANLKGNNGRNGLTGNTLEKPGSSFKDEVDSSHVWRNRRYYRVKCSYEQLLKPQNSLESCLMSQIDKEQIKMEEDLIRSLPSSSKTVWPLLITDGGHVISRTKIDSFHAQTGTGGTQSVEAENVWGISPLTELSTGERCKEELNNSQKFGRESDTNLQTGSLDGTILLCLGVSVGIISSFIVNRSEVGKLKELLKQTENLVQDLQEEIEMRDALTVRELVNENHKSNDTSEISFHNNAPCEHFSVVNVDNLSKNNDKESYYEKVGESSESMSKIEAELEAELERLGLNMNASSLERRLSGLVELDSDFVADFAQGELGAKFKAQDVDQDDSLDQDATCSSTTHSANYAVSPRELSLRLHEVIRARLEERVKELESALESSQRKVQLEESEHRKTRGKLSSSKMRFLSDDESSAAKGDPKFMTNSLVMNLLDEALDAHIEACEELRKMNESDEEDSISVDYGNNHQIHGANDSLHHQKHIGAKSEELSGQVKASVTDGSRLQLLFYDGVSEEEMSDSNDEMEELIKEIVEKTKKGSAVVLNAQRLLFTMDENEK